MNEETQKILNKSSNNIDFYLEEIMASYNEIDNILNSTINTGKGIWDGISAQEYIENWNGSKMCILDIVKNIEKEKDVFEEILHKINNKKNE